MLLRFYFEEKPTLFDIKAFAIYSTYLETKYFSIIENHFTEELGGLLLFIGLAFVTLSKERIEKPEYNTLRLKSFIITFFFTYAFIIATVLFVYGIAFIKIILMSLVLQSLVYIIVFKYFLLVYNKSESATRNEYQKDTI
ncbi:MAG TPA: hypothetical protein ENN33_02870 [Ignavibacteria bacterium]|nr:hypothetical protein [Ignavibacteria bacterium]